MRLKLWLAGFLMLLFLSGCSTSKAFVDEMIDAAKNPTTNPVYNGVDAEESRDFWGGP
jgi:hypothetical protein